MHLEDKIISQYFQPLANIQSTYPADYAIGDDAAVITAPAGKQLVISSDNAVAGIHFLADTPADDVAWRALAMNLSDLAAMAATPAWFSLNICLPKIDHAWLELFSAGLNNLARQFKCQLIGGNTSRGELNIGITIYGLVNTAQAIFRHGMQAGDDIYVTGYLGDGAAGLKCLTTDKLEHAKLINHFKRPTARVECGLALRHLASAMMDISDGLATDLPRLANASRLGATINVDNLPLSDSMLQFTNQEQAQHLALTGGDDYELLFSASSINKQRIQQVSQQLNLPITLIGKATDKQEVHYHKNNVKYRISSTEQYTHF